MCDRSFGIRPRKSDGVVLPWSTHCCRSNNIEKKAKFHHPLALPQLANSITLANVERASTAAIKTLDEHFFRVHFDCLTPMEKQYLRAMAELGPGPHRSGEIADRQRHRVQAVAPLRNGLIAKGMIWSSNHGDTAFTVPFFDEFMTRIIPNDDWLVIS